MFRKISTVLFGILACFIVFTSPVDASGLRLVKSGDAYYLSTTEEDNNSTTTTTYEVVSVDSTTSAKKSDQTAEERLVNGNVTAPQGYSVNIGSLINFLLRVAMIIAILLVFFNLIMAGLGWITSGGDKGKIDAARQRIIAALVGILVLSAAFALAQIVAYVLGFDSFNEIFKSIKPINR